LIFISSSPWRNLSVAINRDQKRALTTFTPAFAVLFAVVVTTFAESFPATFALWPTTSPANEGTARQLVRAIKANSFFIFPPFLLRSVPEDIRSATEQPCFHTSDKGTADTKLKTAFGFFVRNLFRRTCAERRWGGARSVGGVGSGHVSKSGLN
jgi:hypothetical protein